MLGMVAEPLLGFAEGSGCPQSGGQGLSVPDLSGGQGDGGDRRTAMQVGAGLPMSARRTRTASEPWRRRALSAEAQMKTRQDSALWLLPMVLCEVARSVREEKGWLGTGEADGKLDTPPGGYASFWAWPETQEFAKKNGMGMAKFDQGPLGHEPTMVLTNAEEVLALHGRLGPGDIVGRIKIAAGR